MRKTILMGILTIILLSASLLSVQLLAAPTQPTGEHCGDVGTDPNDPTFCGCTWGTVYVQGQPIWGAVVTLTFGSNSESSVTKYTSLESLPYYSISGQKLGAQRGDVMTLTATFAGRTINRTFRAVPNSNKEQKINLVFPQIGLWTPIISKTYNGSLLVDGNILWAAGANGVTAIDLQTNSDAPQSLPWENTAVNALARSSDGHIWATGANGIAEYNGTAWFSHTIPTTMPLSALAINTQTNTIWAGGGDDTSGILLIYTDTWRVHNVFSYPLTTLAIDRDGFVWAGTWEDGIYRQTTTGWIHYTITNGLPSNNISSIASHSDAIWVGTSPMQISSQEYGGVGRYSFSTDSWDILNENLPLDTFYTNVPGRIEAIAINTDGTPWIGVSDGVRVYAADNDWWLPYTTTHGLRQPPISALAISETVFAATGVGVDQLQMNEIPGEPPSAYIIQPTTAQTVSKSISLTVVGTGNDVDGGSIMAWMWQSDKDGHLCTTPTCTLDTDALAVGTHHLIFKVQDDEGEWSSPAGVTITIEPFSIFLPLILR